MITVLLAVNVLNLTAQNIQIVACVGVPRKMHLTFGIMRITKKDIVLNLDLVSHKNKTKRNSIIC